MQNIFTISISFDYAEYRGHFAGRDKQEAIHKAFSAYMELFPEEEPTLIFNESMMLSSDASIDNGKAILSVIVEGSMTHQQAKANRIETGKLESSLSL